MLFEPRSPDHHRYYRDHIVIVFIGIVVNIFIIIVFIGIVGTIFMPLYHSITEQG